MLKERIQAQGKRVCLCVCAKANHCCCLRHSSTATLRVKGVHSHMCSVCVRVSVGMPLEPYEAYLDIRKYGSVPHSGFGLGFERLILFATGLENIREVIPFPRWPGSAAC